MARENRRPGSRDWFVARPRQHAIAGFVDRRSYLPGRVVTLRVDSHARPFSFAVYRLGHYEAKGARLMLHRRVPRNRFQPGPEILDDRPGGAKLLLVHWHPSARFRIPRNWLSGFYLVRLARRSKASSYASFVVRARDPAPIVVVYATDTWQAYNTWGGVSLYRDLRLRGDASQLQTLVAHEVSTQRPYHQGYGAGDIFRFDRPLLDWLERRGVGVSYATDADVRAGRVAGPRTRLVILAGHPEYATLEMLSRYRRLVARGVSIAIFGGNSFAWRSRFTRGGKVMVVWRRRSLDPMARSAPTVRWRAQGDQASRLTGVEPYAAPVGTVRAKNVRTWEWRGTGVRDNEAFGRALGVEHDGVPLGAKSGRSRLVILAAAKPRARRTSLRCGLCWSLRTTPAGSFVFSGSELGFDWRLAYPTVTPAHWVTASGPPDARARYPAKSHVRRAVQRLAANLLSRATRPSARVRARARAGC